MALHIMPEDSLNLGHNPFVKIILKLHLQPFWHNFENGKMKKIGFFLQDFITLLQNYSTKFFYTNSPWVCVTKVCSDGGATYIIGEIIAN